MVAVRPEKGEHIEKAIRKFLKKCKNARIVEECRERKNFIKPSAVRRDAERRRQRTLRKLKDKVE